MISLMNLYSIVGAGVSHYFHTFNLPNYFPLPFAFYFLTLPNMFFLMDWYSFPHLLFLLWRWVGPPLFHSHHPWLGL